MTARRTGFTLVELLVALVVGALVMGIVLISVDRTIRNHAVLERQGEALTRMARLRRLLHRDFVNADTDTLTFTSGALELHTTHALGMDAPFRVLVEWDFSTGGIIRRETVEDMDLERELTVLPRYDDFTAELYDNGKRRWLPARTLFSMQSPAFTALRLTLTPQGGEEMTIIERLPAMKTRETAP